MKQTSKTAIIIISLITKSLTYNVNYIVINKVVITAAVLPKFGCHSFHKQSCRTDSLNFVQYKAWYPIARRLNAFVTELWKWFWFLMNYVYTLIMNIEVLSYCKISFV